MQIKFSLLVVVLSVLVVCMSAQSSAQTSKRPICKRGEEYLDCGSSCTEPKCKSRPVACPAVCTQGCYCRAGYARNIRGVCIPRYMCAYKNYNGE
ncbi:chymotrypsin-elastase inhibitor ixodidin-like [Anopheles stephensi]|uniref:chymotrypsin-elastase inhibitor ixodidin-like n=1 Tax=Anopheles stephensi TaxID=30069 RepID=UPI001658BC6B|nr:chymotrypsin-elastase inhibitor ixodidin-like [Anopheles stephensi]